MVEIITYSDSDFELDAVGWSMTIDTRATTSWHIGTALLTLAYKGEFALSHRIEGGVDLMADITAHDGGPDGHPARGMMKLLVASAAEGAPLPLEYIGKATAMRWKAERRRDIWAATDHTSTLESYMASDLSKALHRWNEVLTHLLDAQDATRTGDASAAMTALAKAQVGSSMTAEVVDAAGSALMNSGHLFS